MCKKISFKRRACPAFGGGRLFYTVSHPSPKLKLTAMHLTLSCPPLPRERGMKSSVKDVNVNKSFGYE